jgi:ubiquinone biosynthesis protein COQ4
MNSVLLSVSPQPPLEGQVAEAFLKGTARLSDRLGLSVPAIVDIEYLRTLPPGTFGRTWADHLDHHHLQPLTTGPRRQQLHDGVHVLTGYGIDPIGEAEVQAFLLGARFRLVHLVLGMALLRGIARQSKLPGAHLTQATARHRLRQAYYRGRHSRFTPDAWQPESLWVQSLAQVKAYFRI